MRRNCNLELRLVPPAVSFYAADLEDRHDGRHHRQPNTTLDFLGGRNQPNDQQLTIFYNGKIIVSDVTELQAKTIIFLANREMQEEKAKTPLPLSPPLLQPQMSSGLSMKRSLQRFLQKRKNRVQAAFPYHHRS